MPCSGFDRVTLLTGFPSFVPRRLARHIVEQEPRGLLYALVQSKFASEARAVLASWPSGLRERVIVLDGDAAAMDLGLSGAELRTITPRVDVIHQAAHVTYAGVDRESAAHVNVAAAREILEVARLCPHLGCLAFHSTAEVAGNRSGVVLESELEAGQRFDSPVVETRAWAEKIVRGAVGELPIVILRPATVVGDSVTGEIDRFDGPYLLVLQIVSSAEKAVLPPAARADTPLNLVPIDYVVRASYAIARDPRAVGRTFHLVDPHPRSARAVFEAVAQASGRPSPRGYLPSRLTSALVRGPTLERVSDGARAWLDGLLRRPLYDTANAADILAGTGIVCPPFDDYVAQLVAFAQAKLHDRREAAAASGEGIAAR